PEESKTGGATTLGILQALKNYQRAIVQDVSSGLDRITFLKKCPTAKRGDVSPAERNVGWSAYVLKQEPFNDYYYFVDDNLAMSSRSFSILTAFVLSSAIDAQKGIAKSNSSDTQKFLKVAQYLAEAYGEPRKEDQFDEAQNESKFLYRNRWFLNE